LFSRCFGAEQPFKDICIGNTFFRLITRKGLFIEKTALKILRFRVIMIKKVGIADAVSLEVRSWSSAYEDGESFPGRLSLAPYMSLKATFQGPLPRWRS